MEELSSVQKHLIDDVSHLARQIRSSKVNAALAFESGLPGVPVVSVDHICVAMWACGCLVRCC